MWEHLFLIFTKPSYRLAVSLIRIIALNPQTVLKDIMAQLLQIRKLRLNWNELSKELKHESRSSDPQANALFSTQWKPTSKPSKH